MNYQTRPVRPIDGPLRSRVNQWAHAQGQAHEMHLRAQIMTRLEKARAEGAGFDELADLLAYIETEITTTKGT
jgi:glutathione S-transferase